VKKRKRSAACVTLLACLLFATLSAPVGAADAERDAEAILRQRDSQGRARRLMGELLDGVLQSHMRQLEENGLSHVPLYKDLTALRGRTEELVKKEMTEAVELLSKAAAAGKDERTGLYKAAQDKMHEILLRVLAERERLRLRRQLGDLIDQVQLLTRRQQAIRRDTLALSDESVRAIAAAIQSQKAVQLLGASLQKALKTAAEDPGDLGALAADAERALRKEDVPAAITQAVAQLTASEFVNAAGSQQKVLDGLQKVMAALRIPGRTVLVEARKRAAELLKRQEKLRDAIRTQSFTAANVGQWVAGQGAVTDGLRGLVVLLGANEPCTRLTDIGARASEGARRAVFSQFKTEALDKQGRVVGALAQMLEELSRQIALEGDRTAAELMKLHVKLTAVHKKLQAVRGEHDAVAKTAAADRNKAAGIEGRVQKALEKIAEDRELSRIVLSRIRGAADAAETAGKALAAGDADRDGKVLQSDRAIRHAVGEAREAGAKARRDALAVTLGEVNRAAEVLDRAAAASQQLGREMQDGTLSPEQAEYPRSEMEKVQQIAGKVAEGVKVTAPEAVAPLTKAAGEAGKLVEELAKRKQDPAAPKQVAETLDGANDELRKVLAKTAGELVAAIREELGGLVTLQDELQSLLRGPDRPTPPQLRPVADKAFDNTASVGAALHRAADGLQGPEKAETAAKSERDMQRSRVLAQMKREDLEELLREAERLARLAERQDETADAIDDAAESGDGLAEAMSEHAESLSGVGEAAQSMSGAGQIANEPLNEASELASTLGMGPDQGGEEAMDSGMPGSGTPMGAGMMPSSPMGTAMMMAAGAGAEGAGMGEGMGMGMGMGQGMGMGMGQMMGPAGAGGEGGAGSTGEGSDVENAERQDGTGEYKETMEGESEAGWDGGDTARRRARRAARAWFASLPEAVRKAVKSRDKSSLPRGYEELLRRYFEDRE
jgi:hypothetical protein